MGSAQWEWAQFLSRAPSLNADRNSRPYLDNRIGGVFLQELQDIQVSDGPEGLTWKHQAGNTVLKSWWGP